MNPGTTLMTLTVVAWTLLSLMPAHGGQPIHQEKKKEVIPMSAHLVSLIDTKSFGSGVLRIGDLNANGAPDLLLVQADTKTREITCLTAITIHGKVLWQHGKPAKKNAYMYGDLPVQVYDWDNDGRNEVLYIKPAGYAGKIAKTSYPRERAERYVGDATLIVLDATTGEEKRRFPTPAPADDALVFADLTGRGRPQDLVVKDRYYGEVVDALPIPWKTPMAKVSGKEVAYTTRADVWGDGRQEVIMFGANGTAIYANPRSRSLPTQYNETAYTGM